MHFDALTLACMSAELNQKLLPGRVQQVLLVDAQSIGLEIYANQQRQYLLLAADSAHARVHLVANKLRRGAEAQSPLLLLLRKYVRNAILETICQPDPTERVLNLGFEHAQHGSTTLVVELIGRRSNLILTGPGGKILDCTRRARHGEEGQRTLWPGAIYAPPLPQAKLALPQTAESPVDTQLRDTQWQSLLLQGGKLWRVLVDGVAGISPTLARETAWRVAGDIQVDATKVDVAKLVSVLQSLWQPVQSGDWQPGVVLDGILNDGTLKDSASKDSTLEDGRVIGFAPYHLHFRGQFEPTSSLSQALERFYAASQQARSASVATAPQTADPYAAQRGAVAATIRQVRKRLARNLAALADEEPAPGAAAQLRTEAEWLLALSSQIEKGQAQLEIDLGEEKLTIALDAKKTPVEQAEAMFKRAAKAERAAEFIPQRRALLQNDLAFLAQLETDLRFAENQPEISAVQEEMRRARLITERKRTPSASAQESARPLRYLGPEGLAILVGRNARQNEMVTFKLAGADDLWLHVHGAPGAHVVVRSGGQPVGEETLLLAAQLAGHYSSLRGERAAPVSVTTRRFVTRVSGGRTGQVHVRNAETITVVAELPPTAILSGPRS